MVSIVVISGFLGGFYIVNLGVSMSTWILIISISASDGVGLESIEFTSKETCEIAQSKAIEELDSYLNKVRTVCVEK